MSLHPYLPPPPLALAIAPAPPIKPSKPKDKEAEKKEKPTDKVKADEKKPEKADDAHDAHKTLVDGTYKPQAAGAEKPKDASPPEVGVKKQLPDVPETPLTSMSMMPEPPTPEPGQAPADQSKGDKKPEQEAAGTPAVQEDGRPTTKPRPEPEPEPEPKPLRLTGPSPHTPIRTRLDMNPIKPYPPIDTDPRGAYHLYAKGCSKEWILIDVTKDGWLTEFWRERDEREALARLRGEDVRRAERELERIARNREKRKVPNTAGELLVQLWNDLAEEPWTELPTEVFWDRYDWSTPQAQVHAQAIPKEERKDNTSLMIEGQEVEWTKEGVEEILGTVGVQCAYNSDAPIHGQWTGLGRVSRDRAFLIHAHGYFILRPKEWLIWKPEEGSDQFEVLVTSGHDRVFGEMVKAQRAEAKKKDQEAADKAKKAAAAKAGDDVKGEKKESPKENGEDAKLKVDVEAEAEAEADAEAVLKEAGEAKVMLAVPVKDLKDVPEAAKHEHEIQLAQPEGVPLNAEKPDVAIKVEDGKAGGGAENMKMEDIKAAFQALEAAAGGLKEKGKNESEQLIWTWAESCERWRWRNFEAGVHEVGLGGWEERDWKVFADGKGTEEFEGDMEVAEVIEEDIHDWSC